MGTRTKKLLNYERKGFSWSIQNTLSLEMIQDNSKEQGYCVHLQGRVIHPAGVTSRIIHQTRPKHSAGSPLAQAFNGYVAFIITKSGFLQLGDFECDR